TQSVLVVLSDAPVPESLLEAAAQVEAGLMAAGEAVMPGPTAREHVEGSFRVPASLSEAEQESMLQAVGDALEHVAFGRHEATRLSVDQVLAHAERALETINRDDNAARHLLDACLALVRSALILNDRQAALAEAQRCRRLVPEGAPSEFAHPPQVLQLMSEAEDLRRRTGAGALTIESIPAAGCTTVLNGRPMGPAPVRREYAPAGAYRVQMECGQSPARSRLVTLGDADLRVTMDSSFDAALDTDARIVLRYPDAAALDSTGLRHTKQLGQALHTPEVVLLVLARGALTLLRQRGDDGVLVGKVALPWPAPEPVLRAAAAELAAQTGFPDAEREAETGSSGEVTSDAESGASHGLRLPLRITSALLAAAGVALFATGVAFEQKQRGLAVEGNTIDADTADGRRQLDGLDRSYDRYGKLRWLGLGGGLLMTSAVPLLNLQARGGLPWWSYGAGAVGLGLLSWAGVELTHDGRCQLEYDTGACARVETSGGRAGLVLAAALPFLAVPISHMVVSKLVRPASDTRSVLSVVPAPRGVILTVRKELRAF
ncbi:MAG: hypothetical protein RL385_5507, partial [Pseudomonadota bacterium]